MSRPTPRQHPELPGRSTEPLGRQELTMIPGNDALFHPRQDDQGKLMKILRPSTPTELSEWTRPGGVAAAIPEGDMPQALNGISFSTWANPPSTSEEWESTAKASRVSEPVFHLPKGMASAAGVVIQERDGRVWMVCPTNQFGGYEVTFPKGRTDGKSLQATALVEAFEETGLRVRLVRHLIDLNRTQTYTRYYLAERIGGTPSEMGWESQCVMLVPTAHLPLLPLATSDKPFLSTDLSTSSEQ